MEEVEFSTAGAVGVIRLNRPQAINALTLSMCQAIVDQLTEWRDDNRLQAVAVTGAGERGLCAGGDVKAVRQAILDGDDPDIFFATEYAADHALATFPKRVVALMPGVVMGGGLGVAAHADLRIVTPDSKLAMPETKIGFFPDVGMTHPLARAGDVGMHYALTGDTFGAVDAIGAGLADVAVSDAEAALAAVIDDPTVAAADLPGVAATSGRSSDAAWLASYLGADPVAIVAALRQHGVPAATDAADAIEQRSPLAVSVTHQAMRRARAMTLSEVFAQDLRVAQRVIRHPDFLEGVRCQLVDKQDSPTWHNGSLAEINRRELHRIFG